MRLDLIPKRLQAWARDQAARTTAAFSAGGHQRHGGDNWQPLALSTIRRKGHAVILVQSGSLSRSIGFEASEFGDGFDLAAVVGAYHPLAAIHTFSKRASLPRRKVVDLTFKDKELFKRDIKQTLENAR